MKPAVMQDIPVNIFRAFELEIERGYTKSVILMKTRFYLLMMIFIPFNTLVKTCKAWWKKNFISAEEMIKKSLDEFKSIEERCENFDKQLYDDAMKAGGKTYADLCVLAYRQSLAAHKLVRGPEQ